MNIPIISVVVPVFNGEIFLLECLNSIKEQSFCEWECICVDDGSQDGTWGVLEDIVHQDSRFRIFHKENGGVTSARRLGVEKSEGQFICFVDADDCLVSNALEVLLWYQRKYDAEVVRGSFLHWNGEKSNGVVHGDYPVNTKQYEVHPGTEYIERLLRVCSLSMTLYDAALFRSKERFPAEEVVLGEDGLTLFNVLADAQRMVLVDDVVYLYRTNETSCSRELYSHPEKELKADIDFTEALTVFIEQHSFPDIKHLKYYVVDNIYGKFIGTEYFKKHRGKLIRTYLKYFCLNPNVQVVVFRFNWKKWVKMWLAFGKML